MSMTRNNESDSLKSSIANLVRQNKKRDELINFLMERVETLTNAVNTLALPASIPSPETDSNERIPDHTSSQQTEQFEQSEQFEQANDTMAVNNPEILKQVTELSLDDVLNSIQSVQLDAVTPPTIVNIAQSESHQNEELEVSEFANTTSNLHDNTGISSPVKQPISNLNLDDVLNSIPTTYKDDDLISTILGADDSASNHGDYNMHSHGDYNMHSNTDHSDVPPEKLKLLGMSVKQLKQIAKDMNIKSRGNKNELVDLIWEKTCSIPKNENTALQTTISDLVSNDADMDALLNESKSEDKTEINNISAIETPQLVVEDFPDDI